MKIEEGKSYRTRDGKKAGPVRIANADCHPDYSWIGRLGERQTTWLDDGAWSLAESDYDLIAEWQDEPTGPVVTETVKRIKAGKYGRVYVGRNDINRDEIDVMLLDRKGNQIDAGNFSLWELRSIIATLTEIADALDDAK